MSFSINPFKKQNTIKSSAVIDYSFYESCTKHAILQAQHRLKIENKNIIVN